MKLVAIAATALTAGLFLIAPQVISAAPKPTPLEWLGKNSLPDSKGTSEPAENRVWFDAYSLTIEGHPFEDTQTSYSRIPVKNKDKVTEGVWRNGLSAAGVAVRFVTDATTISASWDYDNPMNHMALTGSGGLDVYTRGKNKWEYYGTGQADTGVTSVTKVIRQALRNKPVEAKEYLVFLPLYSKVTQVRIGIPAGSKIAPAPDHYKNEGPIVFYGTSITQGGCASRSGMSHPAILRRWLDVPVINFGFSGSGRCEPIMGEMLAEIPAQLYVIETVPNMRAEMISERVVPFIERLREAKPDTPILMVDSPNYLIDKAMNDIWHEQYRKLKQKGVKNLHLLKGDRLYSGNEEPTVDGVHPTDLGFYEMARGYEPVIRRLIRKNNRD